jgi:hypothetical protein
MPNLLEMATTKKSNVRKVISNFKKAEKFIPWLATMNKHDIINKLSFDVFKVIKPITKIKELNIHSTKFFFNIRIEIKIKIVAI